MKNLTLPHTGIAAAAADVCLMSASPALAADITFSYGQPGEQYKVYGFDKKEASLEDRVLKVTFDEPYEIPAEGVYVGYSS